MLPLKFSVGVKEHQDKLPTMFWLTKDRIKLGSVQTIALALLQNSFEHFKILISCLTAVKFHVIRSYEPVYERLRKYLLSKLMSRGFLATILSSLDFSALYRTLPNNLIKKILLDLIKRTFKKTFIKNCTLHIACYDKKAFFTSTDHRGYKRWSCHNEYDAFLGYYLH